MRLPVWLQGYALHPLILVFCLSIWSSSVTSQESPCHSSFGQCFRSSHRVIQPTSYSIVQGFQRPKADRSYDDRTYTSDNQLQYPNPWVGNTTIVWLKGGTGQLTDGFCASREFRSEDEQYPWVGWDSLRIDDDAQISPVPLYFTFGESISLTSIKIHTVSPMESGIKLFQRINVSITMDDDADFDKKVWMSVLTDITKPSDTSNTSTDLIVEFELPSGLPLARHVRIQLMASPNYSWIYVSEVAFCGQEFAHQVSISSAAVQYMVESEPGTVRCQADNVDSLELIHVTSGQIVMNSSSAPQTLTVADSIMTPTVPGHDGQKYICRGNNSVVNAFNQTIIKLSVAKALDIFRASYHRSVAPGQSVLLQCCVKDNRRRAVKSPISWVWVDVATRARLAETSEPYVLVNNITAPAGAAVASYSCTVRSTGYRDYSNVARVAVSGAPAPQTGRYSNMLQNDLCAETYLPNTESPSSATPTSLSPGQCPTVTCQSTAIPTVASAVPSANEFGTISAVLLVFLFIATFALIIVSILLLKSRRRRQHSFQHQQLRTSHEYSVAQTHHKSDPTPTYSPPVSLSPSPVGSMSGHNKARPRTMSESSNYATPVQKSERNGSRKNIVRPSRPYEKVQLDHTSPDHIDPNYDAIYDKVQEPDQLQLYAEPSQVQVQTVKCMPKLSTTNCIYEEPFNPEKLLEGDTVAADVAVNEKRMSRLPALYEEPPPLARDEGPRLINPAKLDWENKTKVGEGQFGDVYVADLLSEPTQRVAVKTLKATTNDENRKSFEKEVKFMSRQHHAHVVKLLGICDSQGFIAMVMENMENGDLHSYLAGRSLLLKPKADGPLNDKRLSLPTLVRMMQHVAAGMEYLSANAYVHRDLAARNCLVGSDLTIKLGDFGLTCHLYDRVYYRVVGRAVLPLQWMAPESFYGQFSVASDVYSFGVTCWEILKMCKEGPFADLDPSELINATVRARNNSEERPTLVVPSICPKPVEALLWDCWKMDPQQRPSFSHLNAELHKIATLMLVG